MRVGVLAMLRLTALLDQLAGEVHLGSLLVLYNQRDGKTLGQEGPLALRCLQIKVIRERLLI